MSLLIKALEQAAKDRDSAKSAGTPAGTASPAASPQPTAPGLSLEPALEPPPKPRGARTPEPAPRGLASEPRGLASEPRGLASEPRGLASEPRGLASEPPARSPAAEPALRASSAAPALAPPAPQRTPSALSIDSTMPGAPPRRANGTAAALSHIDAQHKRAHAATVMQASGGAASNLISNLRGNPIMMLGALAVLFGIGFGVYVYLQIAQPGLFIRQAATRPQEKPPAPPPVPTADATPPPAGAAAPIPGAPMPGPDTSPANPAVAIPGAPPIPPSMVPPSATAPASSASSAPIAGSVGVAAPPPAPAAAGSVNPAPVTSASVIANRAAEVVRDIEPPRAIEPRIAGGPARAPEGATAPATSPTPSRARAGGAAAAAAAASPGESTQAARERIAVTPAANQPRLNPMVSQGYAQLQSGNLEDARGLYSKAVQNEPMNVDALLGLAYIAAQENRSDEAMKYYLRILQLNPRHAPAQAAMIGLMGRADPVASESRLKQLIAREPSAFLHFVLGNVYADQTLWAQAQQAYFQAHHMEPENPDYAYNLAIGLDHLRQGKLALDFYRRAERLAQAQGRSNFNLSHARERISSLSSQLE